MIPHISGSQYGIMLLMDGHKYIELFEVIKNHKAYFDEMSECYFNDIIKPIFEANGQKKLKLGYCKDALYIASSSNGGSYVIRTQTNIKKNYLFGGEWINGQYGERINIIEDAENLVGGGSGYRKAFLYVLSTNLMEFTKYFGVNELTGWFFHSGLNDAQKKREWVGSGEMRAFSRESYERPCDLYHYSRPWYDIVKSGLTRGEALSAEAICERLRVSGIEDLMSGGYADYRSSIQPEDIKIPKRITNKMELELWKNGIAKINISGKNIKRVMYARDGSVRMEYGQVMRAHMLELYPKVVGRKYFIY